MMSHHSLVYDPQTLNCFYHIVDSGKDYYVLDNAIIWGDFWRDIFSLQIKSSKESRKENRVSKAVAKTFERKGFKSCVTIHKVLDLDKNYEFSHSKIDQLLETSDDIYFNTESHFDRKSYKM